MGMLKGRWLKSAVLAAKKFLLTRFDRISTISGRMMEVLQKKGVAEERVVFFPNWVDIRHIQQQQIVSSYRAQLNIPNDSIVVLFSGTMNGKQGLSVIPDAARLLADRNDVVFVV